MKFKATYFSSRSVPQQLRACGYEVETRTILSNFWGEEVTCEVPYGRGKKRREDIAKIKEIMGGDPLIVVK